MYSGYHNLPIEIIHKVLLDAIKEDNRMATVLALTCKTVYAWVIPVLYSTVVLTTESQIITFEYTSRASSKIAHHFGRPAERHLGFYVQCLWVGPNQSRLGRTRRNLKYMESNGSDGAAEAASGMQAPGTDVWAYIEIILTSCTTLRALSIVDYPDVILPSIIRRCPPSLESLSIYPSHTLHLDLPDISHLTSLHEITFSQTSLSSQSMRRLLQKSIVHHITARICKNRENVSSRRSLYYLLTNRVAWQLQLVESASPSFKRMKLALMVGGDTNREALLTNLERHISQGYLHIPRTQWDERIVVSVEDGCNECGDVDAVKKLYDDWVVCWNTPITYNPQRRAYH